MLMLTTNYSIGQIAESVGIEDISYFSTLFKKHQIYSYLKISAGFALLALYAG